MLATLLCLAIALAALDLIAPVAARSVRAARLREMARRHEYMDRIKGD